MFTRFSLLQRTAREQKIFRGPGKCENPIFVGGRKRKVLIRTHFLSGLSNVSKGHSPSAGLFWKDRKEGNVKKKFFFN